MVGNRLPQVFLGHDWRHTGRRRLDPTSSGCLLHLYHRGCPYPAIPQPCAHFQLSHTSSRWQTEINVQVMGILITAFEWPLPFIKDTALYRSYVFRFVFYAFNSFTNCESPLSRHLKLRSGSLTCVCSPCLSKRRCWGMSLTFNSSRAMCLTHAVTAVLLLRLHVHVPLGHEPRGDLWISEESQRVCCLSRDGIAHVWSHGSSTYLVARVAAESTAHCFVMEIAMSYHSCTTILVFSPVQIHLHAAQNNLSQESAQTAPTTM